MRLWKTILLFVLGGLAYVLLELMWRGWSHISMFLAGGSCFLLVGRLGQLRPRLPLLLRGLLGAVVITAVELLAGLWINRAYGVWDYRDMPMNFHGQICLPFSLLWLPVSLGAMGIYTRVNRLLSRIFRIDEEGNVRYNPNIKGKEKSL